MGIERIKFVASEYLQASLVSGNGIIGGYKASTVAVKFDNPTLALNVNDQFTIKSTVTGDIGNSVILIGRDRGGVVVIENLSLNGTGLVTGTQFFKHILRANAQNHSGQISINRLSDNSGVITVSSGSLSVKNLFSDVTKNTSTYEKIFLENTSYTNALLNASVYETTNPSNAFSFALATSKNDRESVANLTTAPTGVTIFNNSPKSIPGGYLNTGECIGIWIKCDSGSGVNIPYSLSCVGTVASLIENDPTGVVDDGGTPIITGVGLLQSGDIEYSGSIRGPFVSIFENSYLYGMTSLCYNENNDSLFAAGHLNYFKMGEFSIPTPVKLTGSMTVASCNRGTVLQTAVNTSSKLPNYPLTGISNAKQFGGNLVVGDKLITSIYCYYDGSNSADVSHYSLTPWSNLASGSYSGMYWVTHNSPGYTAGDMCRIPSEHTGVLGAKYFTGQGAIPIISRTSNGPCAISFDPDNLANSGLPSTTFIKYTAVGTLPETTYVLGDRIKGMVFPDNTNSLLFFTSHGNGPNCYGTADECGDLCGGGKGYHRHPYSCLVLAYSVSGLIAVKSGLMSASEIRPYAVWNLFLPSGSDSCRPDPLGAAWDSGNRRLFVSMANTPGGQGGESIIHVYKIPKFS